MVAVIGFGICANAQELVKIIDTSYDARNQKLTVRVEITYEGKQNYSSISFEVTPRGRTIADLLYGGAKYGTINDRMGSSSVSFDCKREGDSENKFQRCNNYTFNIRVTDKTPKK